MPYDLEPLRLDTIHPELVEQFDHLMTQVVESFHDESPRLDPVKRTAQVQITVGIEFCVEDGRIEIEAQVKGKLPGYRQVVQRFARLPHGGTRILVEQDDADRQVDLIGRKAVTP